MVVVVMVVVVVVILGDLFACVFFPGSCVFVMLCLLACLVFLFVSGFFVCLFVCFVFSFSLGVLLFALL